MSHISAQRPRFWTGMSPWISSVLIGQYDVDGAVTVLRYHLDTLFRY